MIRSISRSNARRSPSRVNSPASSRDQIGVERRRPSRARRTGSRARRRRRTGRPRCRRTGRPAMVAAARPARARARSPRPALGQEELVPRPPVAPALELDPGLFADARRARLRRPRRAAGPSAGRGRRAPRASGRRAPVSARRWRAGDPGDEAQVVVLASTGRRIRRPSGRRRSARPAPG